MIRRLALLLVVVLVVGCGKPNRSNIALRKKNQSLEGKIAKLEYESHAKDATIRGLSERVGTVPTLDSARLARLFTVHAIRVNRLTGGVDLDGSKPGDEGIKVYVNLLDQHGDTLKSAGSFVVEAFDLADPKSPKLGQWEFPVEKAQEYWHSFLTRYEYVLPLPWHNAVPRHPDVTVKVTFTDELTGRKFTQQRVVKVDLPPTTQPTAQAGVQ